MGSDAAARRLSVSAAAALIVSLMARGALGAPGGDPKDAARELGRAGVARLAAKDWEHARDLLQRAYALHPAPTLALREGDALVQLGRLVEASAAYERAASTPIDEGSPRAFRAAVAEAHASLAALRPRIPRLRIALVGVASWTPGLDVRVDGVAIPAPLLGGDQPIDPGLHTVEAAVGGGDRVVKTVRLEEGGLERVVLELAPPRTEASAPIVPRVVAPAPATPARSVTVVPPPREGSATRAVGWTGVGLGVAGVGVGVVAGLLATSRASRLEETCPAGRCPPSSRPDLDAFRELRTVSTIGYVAGAVAGGAGIALLVLGPKAPSREARRAVASRIALRLGPGALGVEGAF